MFVPLFGGGGGGGLRMADKWYAMVTMTVPTMRNNHEMNSTHRHPLHIPPLIECYLHLASIYRRGTPVPNAANWYIPRATQPEWESIVFLIVDCPKQIHRWGIICLLRIAAIRG